MQAHALSFFSVERREAIDGVRTPATLKKRLTLFSFDSPSLPDYFLENLSLKGFCLMAKNKRFQMSLSLCLLSALVATTAVPAPAQTAGEVVIYSGRREPLIMPVIDLFKKATGIQVTLKSGEDQAL